MYKFTIFAKIILNVVIITNLTDNIIVNSWVYFSYDCFSYYYYCVRLKLLVVSYYLGSNTCESVTPIFICVPQT